MRSWRTTIGVLGAAALLAACGDDDEGGFADQDPEEITAEVEADMKALSSVRMTGELVTDGERMSIDMAVSTAGDCEGTIGQDGAEAEIISVDGSSYMKPDAAFWELFAGEQASMLVEIVGDRWVAVPGEQGDFSEFCNLDQLLDEVGGEDDPRDVEVEGTEQIDGQEAVRLATTTEEGDPVTVWVAAEDPHVILQMEVTQGDEPGTIRFSAFDEPLDVEAPPTAEVVDLSEL